MIQSMTGYASLLRETAQGSLFLELKSVNNRFLDLQFRVVEELRALEPGLRELIAAKIGRGKLDCRISFTPAPAAAGKQLSLNAELLERLAGLEREVRALMPEAQPLGAGEVLRWPGMLGDAAIAADALREPCLALMREALAELCATRAREGAKLRDMIVERVAKMQALVDRVTPLLPQAIAAYQEKLAARLREALASNDEERIRQEIAVFGIKVDVAEELNRLAAHLQEVRRVLDAGGAAGKRLDFLMQELNREANTLGSKSVSKEVSEASIELKLLIEQMREQIQNIE
ncbi:MAG: YicC/YloC family endoribonuclease [Betaproteobacteria bacterium]|nr:YicC/YloC family endoribonuclease [Betaproteobacteria bacterium]